MATVTVSVPEDLRKKMKKFNEVNWSAVSRRAYTERLEELEHREKLKKMLREEEKELAWTIDLGRKLKKDMRKRLKKEGYDV